MDESGVDLTAISFPSDELTVGALRRLYPARLDAPLPTFFDSEPHYNSAAYVLGNLLAKERTLTMDAYNRVAQQGWKEIAPEFGHHAFPADLEDSYVELGLATGLKSATQLVRGIETQGAGQVRRR